MERHRERGEVKRAHRDRDERGHKNRYHENDRRERSRSPRRKDREDWKKETAAEDRRKRERSRSPRRKDREDWSRNPERTRETHRECQSHGDRPRDHQMQDRQKSRMRDEPRRRDRSRDDKTRQQSDDKRHSEGEQRQRQDRRLSPDSRAESHRKHKREDRQEKDISQYEFGGGKKKETTSDEEGVDKDKPNYGLSGKLTAETNTYKGVVIKYNEPEEARIPKTRWRLYGFKGSDMFTTLYVHRQSAYLIGRNRIVVDMPVDHPSCSGQHAVLQYRLVEYEKGDGTTGKKVKPYIIDLESTNGTYVNNNRIDAARYYELKESDMLKFGFSSREYVILHENSQHEKVKIEDADNANTNDSS